MNQQKPPVTVRTPVDAISLVPHVLGFHPEDSIVILSMGGGGRSPHARVDHPHSAGDMLTLLAALKPAMHHWEGRTNLILCYTDDKEHAYATATMLREEMPGVLLEPLMVHQGHLWQIDQDDFEGDGIRYVASDIGMDPLAVAVSRDDLRRDLESGTVTDEFIALLAQEATRMAQPDFNIREEARWLVDRLLLTGCTLLTDAELARISAAVAITDLRDVAWACLGSMHLPMLKDAVRRCGPVAGMRALLAFDAWLAGDGALAWVSLDLTRDVEPDYTMCLLVAEALTKAIDPKTWEPPALSDLAPFKEA